LIKEAYLASKASYMGKDAPNTLSAIIKVLRSQAELARLLSISSSSSSSSSPCEPTLTATTSNIIIMSLSTLSSHSLGLGEWGGEAGGEEAGGLVKAFSEVLCI
jgi:hypothetical protein